MSNSLQPHGLYSPWNSPGQNTGVGSLSLLQGKRSQPRDQTQFSLVAGGTGERSGVYLSSSSSALGPSSQGLRAPWLWLFGRLLTRLQVIISSPGRCQLPTVPEFWVPQSVLVPLTLPTSLSLHQLLFIQPLAYACCIL